MAITVIYFLFPAPDLIKRNETQGAVIVKKASFEIKLQYAKKTRSLFVSKIVEQKAFDHLGHECKYIVYIYVY